jgi:site-specific DNA-adenine methylase
MDPLCEKFIGGGSVSIHNIFLFKIKVTSILEKTKAMIQLQNNVNEDNLFCQMAMQQG